jgi:inward rectifier potassium channel
LFVGTLILWQLYLFMLRNISNLKFRQSELGFGRQLTGQSRLMNPDGTFNVLRRRNRLTDNLYFHLITMPAWQFFLLTFAFFGLLNALFAEIYMLIGIDQLNGLVHTTWAGDYMKAFFFSSQTLTTVGYGHISPSGLGANIVASIESFLGLLTFALISGLLYGRFSRPTASIRFSEHMLYAPYKDNGNAYMFRMVNPRRSELLESEAMITLAINQADPATGAVQRRFFQLDLELSKITFFSLSWTVVHPLTENSPLWGFTYEDLKESNAEFLISVKGTDESTEQMVHARRSYTPDEVVWNARFTPIMEMSPRLPKPIIHTHKVGAHEMLDK